MEWNTAGMPSAFAAGGPRVELPGRLRGATMNKPVPDPRVAKYVYHFEQPRGSYHLATTNALLDAAIDEHGGKVVFALLGEYRAKKREYAVFLKRAYAENRVETGPE